MSLVAAGPLAGPATVRVVLADRHALDRNLLRAVFLDRGIHVVAETDSTAELAALCRRERPDVVVTDSRLDGGSVAEVVRALRRDTTAVLVVADRADPEQGVDLLERGASGYLSRDAAPAEVAEAVRAVAAGDAVLDPTTAGAMLAQWRELRRGGHVPRAEAPALTQREADVLAGMVDGLAAKGIARRLGLSPKTVENHKIRIFDKLGVRTNAQAVCLAIGLALVPARRSEENPSC